MIENDDVTLQKVVENLVDTVLAVRDEDRVFLLPSESICRLLQERTELGYAIAVLPLQNSQTHQLQ